MAITRRQATIGFSVLYLVGLTIFAAYALHSSNRFSLPIPNIIPALTIALPPLAGIALETVMTLNARLADRGHLQASRVFQVTVSFFLVFEAVLATLAGIHHSPSGSLTCGLKEKWMHMWQVKDGSHVKRIQDAFQCCGFMSPLDMAFPFKHGELGDDTCLKLNGWDKACIEPWKQEERKVAIMLLVVPVAVFVWKVAIIMVPSSQSSWLPSHIRLPGENGPEGVAARRRARPAIGYHDVEEAGEEDSLRREVNNLNNESSLATHVEGSRDQGNGLFNEANRWREASAVQND